MPDHSDAVTRIDAALRTRASKLDLSRCDLTSIPSKLRGATTITNLNISHNKLTDRALEALWLPNVKSLDLSFNDISLFSLPTIAASPALVLLNLKGNPLAEFPRSVLSCPRLEQLVISPPLEPEQIESLDLSGLDLSVLPPAIRQFKRLKRLNLSSNHLKDGLAILQALSLLEELDLRHNELSWLPTEIWSLVHLRQVHVDEDVHPVVDGVLDLSGLGLTQVPIFTFQFESVRRLNLSGNNLKSVPADISRLRHLQQLDLSNNKLADLPNSMKELLELEFLDMTGNGRWPPPLTVWKILNLKKLRVDVEPGHAKLNLSNKALSSISPCIGSLDFLKSLNLSGNELRSLPSTIGDLPDLEELNLERNHFTELPESLWTLSNLRTLNLRSNELSELSSGVGGLSSLASLTVSSNFLTTLPATVRTLTRLTELDASSNAIRALPSELFALANLESLDLHGNALTLIPEIRQPNGVLARLDLQTNRVHELPSSFGKLTGLRHLLLSHNRLSGLPESFFDLQNLVWLNIDDNRVSNPSALGQLRALRTLGMSQNSVASFPTELLSLQLLETLDLSNNDLETLPDGLGGLTKLRNLNLSGNKLHTVPATLASLRALDTLVLSNNRLSVLPGSLGELTNLTLLDVGLNRLETLPPELGVLKNLKTLAVDDNPFGESITTIANRGTGSLLAYLRSVLKDGLPLYEAKLVLIGEGNVGKSSLLAAMAGERFIDGRMTTHGIEITHIELPHPTLSERIRLNAWDFGGQPVYRITHQFFYSRRSLYAIVWTPREGVEKNDVEGWCERIVLRVGTDASVLVIATHCETGERIARIDEEYFRKKFGRMIVGFYEVDSKTGKNIAELKEGIARVAAGLPHIGERFSAKWKEARDEILSCDKAHIGFEQFQAVCRNHGLDDEEALALAGLLHDLGHIVHFDEDEGLRRVVVLQPEWLTKAIGFVLEDKVTADAFGVLRHDRLAEIWHDHHVQGRQRYATALHPFFLRLMEKFDVSYRLEDGNTSLVAQLVPTPAPALPWSAEEPGGMNAMRLIGLMNQEPPGLIPWLIVRTHRYTTGLHWQRGAVLRYPPHGEAIVELRNRELSFTVRGANPAHFTSILADTYEYLIAQRWPGLDYRMAVPCPKRFEGTPCSGRFKLDVLFKRRTDGRVTMSCGDCGEDLDVNLLLTGFRSPTTDARETVESVKQVIDSELRLHVKAEAVTASTPEPVAIQRVSRASQTLRALLRAMTTQSREYPHLFTLVPEQPDLWSLVGLQRVRHRLTLWCEYPDNEHPICRFGSSEPGEYAFRRKQRWFLRVAPYALVVARVLRSIMPLTGKRGRDTFGGSFNGIEEALARMESVTAEMLNLPPHQLIDPADEHGTNEDDFEALREVHMIMNELDPDRTWGGLKRVHTPSDDYLWLCPIHYGLYEPGLPVLGRRSSDQYDVFLSHNGSDKQAVKALGLALQEVGLRVWLDEWSIRPGQRWIEALEAAIESVRSAAIIVGHDGIGPWERPEMHACIAEFVRRGMPVIPVMLAGARPDLPLFLRQFEWVDLRRGIHGEGLMRLRWGITGQHPSRSG
jgi:internalin A